ncbi:ABC-type polysaccharide/polyol phosphate export permease [Caminicella sporogenes DSM 14501]|uniref:Transport permease protein n=1 Tax=Caminicella sporogenes DSM 14501 TaxID=1121266 RepID=A0A1M6PFF8_9FIRM|nr:ABC transporter permease [Caminicella sporogenes]RKD21419.1 multidrug ABC transporter permease [Caminicella sporogenes]SHK06632.1 ABC-type polysaccharide/polyol phosphate export permease [Caminicella sporogenes DSM 14501]
MEIMTILWREWIFFKRRFWKITSALIVTPLLYLVTFGFGVGSSVTVEGKSYLFYILPGIIALTTMRASYSAISMRISVSRLHEKSFEMYLISPTRMYMLTLGHVLAGAFRGMYSAFLIIATVALFGIFININFLFILTCFINSLMFACLGFLAAMIIDTHYDMNRFTSFVITPMAFLCGTFFSLGRMPYLLRSFIELLPLTHSTRLLRAITYGYKIEGFSFLVIITYTIIFYVLSVRICFEEDRA